MFIPIQHALTAILAARSDDSKGDRKSMIIAVCIFAAIAFAVLTTLCAFAWSKRQIILCNVTTIFRGDLQTSAAPADAEQGMVAEFLSTPSRRIDISGQSPIALAAAEQFMVASTTNELLSTPSQHIDISGQPSMASAAAEEVMVASTTDEFLSMPARRIDISGQPSTAPAAAEQSMVASTTDEFLSMPTRCIDISGQPSTAPDDAKQGMVASTTLEFLSMPTRRIGISGAPSKPPPYLPEPPSYQPSKTSNHDLPSPPPLYCASFSGPAPVPVAAPAPEPELDLDEERPYSGFWLSDLLRARQPSNIKYRYDPNALTSTSALAFTPDYVPERDASAAAISSRLLDAVDPASIPLPTSCTSESMWSEKESYLDIAEVTFPASSTTNSMCSEKAEGDLANTSAFGLFLASLDSRASLSVSFSIVGSPPFPCSESSAAVALKNTSLAHPARTLDAPFPAFTGFWAMSEWIARTDTSSITARGDQAEGTQLRTPGDIHEEGYPRLRDMNLTRSA